MCCKMPEFASLIVFSNNFTSSFLYVIHNLNRNVVVKTKNICSVSVFLKPDNTFFFNCRELEILTVIELRWAV